MDKRNLVQQYLQQSLSSKRFHHCLRVENTGVALAKQFGVDPEKVSLAALLHDICREYSGDSLLKLAAKFDILLDDLDRVEPVLLHGAVGAAVAAAEFGITDPEISEAIGHHITGGAGIGPVAQVVFMADFLEPGRKFEAACNLRNAVAELSFDQLLQGVYDQTLRYLMEQSYTIHPRTVAGRNEVLINLKYPKGATFAPLG